MYGFFLSLKLKVAGCIDVTRRYYVQRDKSGRLLGRQRRSPVVGPFVNGRRGRGQQKPALFKRARRHDDAGLLERRPDRFGALGDPHEVLGSHGPQR